MNPQTLPATVLISFAIVMSGCSATSSHTEKNNDARPSPLTTSQSVSSAVGELFKDRDSNTSLDDYEYTVHWRKLMPGGAALNTSGYVHVLAYTDPRITENRSIKPLHGRELWDANPPPANKVKASRITQIAMDLDRKESNRPSVKGATPLEIVEAYTRYCNAGIGMTDQDWDIVQRKGYVLGVPNEIKSECVPPK